MFHFTFHIFMWLARKHVFQNEILNSLVSVLNENEKCRIAANFNNSPPGSWGHSFGLTAVISLWRRQEQCNIIQHNTTQYNITQHNTI